MCSIRLQASLTAFAPAGQIHFGTEKILTDPEKSKENCLWALQGKGLIWIWILIFNTASWTGRGSCYVTFPTRAMCVCEKANTVVQGTEISHLHMQLFKDLPQYRLLMGVTFLLTHQYPCSFCNSFSLLPTPIPLLSLCLVFFHTLFPKRLAGLTMHCDFFSTGLYEESWRQFSLVSLTSFITYQRNKQTESNSFDHGKSRKSIKNPMKIH